MAGHSKWANIKHRKASVDKKRGKLFTKASKEIIVAARLGGGDPDGNARLRMAIDNAKAVSMPADNIKRAIQRGTGEIEGAVFEDVQFEGYGPGGVAAIIECTTENRQRTVQEVRATFNKYGGNLGETNSVNWNFTRMGEIQLTTTLDEEQLLEIGINAGALDVLMTDDGAIVQCPPETLGTIANAFRIPNVTITEQRLVFEPHTFTEITDADIAKKFIKMLDAFDDNDDVQNVYTNANMDDAMLDEGSH